MEHKGARLRELRAGRGLTLGGLADLVRRDSGVHGGVCTSSLSAYERGRSQLGEGAACRIAAALGVDVGEIWTAPTPEPEGLDRLLAEGRIQLRHRNALARAGVTVERLLTMSASELLALRGVGQTALADVEALRAAPPEWAPVTAHGARV